jgi:hypothetical protein
VFQVARGSVVSDESGERRATLLFPPGTTASMLLPDGSLEQLESLRVRATEFTVGALGEEAMPGELPPTTGYTYAAELSVDEALASGATRVDFNQPVPFYLENFLAIPVGTRVPAGYYDRALGTWVPSANGRVIRITAITGGSASIDADGNGTADTDAQLTALGISAAPCSSRTARKASMTTATRARASASAWAANRRVAVVINKMPPPDHIAGQSHCRPKRGVQAESCPCALPGAPARGARIAALEH